MDRKQLLIESFKKDKFAELAGIEIEEITEESATVSVKLDERHLNAIGFVQGGMLYTLADFAFAVLGNYLHSVTVTQGGRIDYVRPAKTSFLKATATEIIRTGHNTVCDVVITDDEGKTVCLCRFNGFVKEKI